MLWGVHLSFHRARARQNHRVSPSMACASLLVSPSLQFAPVGYLVSRVYSTRSFIYLTQVILSFEPWRRQCSRVPNQGVAHAAEPACQIRSPAMMDLLARPWPSCARQTRTLTRLLLCYTRLRLWYPTSGHLHLSRCRNDQSKPWEDQRHHIPFMDLSRLRVLPHSRHDLFPPHLW